MLLGFACKYICFVGFKLNNEVQAVDSTPQINISQTGYLYRRVREGTSKADMAVGRFEANEAAVFGQMDLFAKRCRKLIELFTIIHQFSELAKVQICL
jgi:hypothetical protein